MKGLFKGLFKGLASAGFALTLCMSCLGGSDGVENPKLELRFEPGGGQAATAGRVSLYAVDRDPALDSLPLLAKAFTGRDAVTFTPEELDSAIARGLRLRGRSPDSASDTLLEFNVVAVSGGLEAWVPGFRYQRLGRRSGFARAEPGNPADLGPFGKLSETHALPPAILDVRGRIGLTGKELGIDYVFIPGSPYVSRVDSGQGLAFPRLPSGVYGLVGADRDSSLYFGAADSLDTGDSTYVAKAWDAIIFVRP
ncbi:MAG: hypothetical protein ABIW76_15895 [Fibrobacteria bacterium]